MGVENQQNIAESLRHAKETMDIHPEIIVHDLSPNIFAGVAEVYGSETSAADPFHVMQLVNRAIQKDLGYYHRQKYGKKIVGLKKLRKLICSLQNQKNLPEMDQIQNDIQLKCTSDDFSSILCRNITKEMILLTYISDNALFFQKLRTRLQFYKADYHPEVIHFGNEMENTLPKHTTSDKACNRVKKQIYQKLKSFYLSFRKPLKQSNITFNKQRWVVFYQPENVTEKRTELLKVFLEQHPELQSYRDLTLRIGSIYRLPEDQIKEEIISGIKIRSEWGSEIVACLKTLRKHSAAVFRFRDFFSKHPELPKRCRSNMEYQNRTVKRIFRSGMYLKSMNRIQNELQLHLGGQVRRIIPT